MVNKLAPIFVEVFMKTEFKVGDKVQAIASPHEGIAEVVVIDENDDPPTIGIQYPGNNEIYYFKGELLGFLKKVEETVEKPKVQFKVGDIVRFGGVEYPLKSSGMETFPFEIVTPAGVFHFLSDGRLSSTHTEPVLTLVRLAEAEKKWVKKTVYRRVNFTIGYGTVIDEDIHFKKDEEISYPQVGWQTIEIEVLE